MALADARVEMRTVSAPASAPEYSPCLHPAKSVMSLHSIKSVGDIPFVESSVDLEFETIFGNNDNISASLFSTPRYSRSDTGNSRPQILESPWTIKVGKNTEAADCVSVPLPKVESPKQEASMSERDQLLLLDEISKAGGAAASMNEFIGTWASTAHYIIIAAAALKRDAAAFATSLRNLLSPKNIVDPNAFSAQYYQFREAYSSLLSLGDFCTVTCGQQGWARASSGQVKPSKLRRDAGLETSWDDRQLLDSFVTLLRTAPGFIASSILQLTPAEMTSFCAESDGSALSVLFHGVLGSAEQRRPRLFAQVLKHLECDAERHQALLEAILLIIFRQTIGSLSEGASAKLERYLQDVLFGPDEPDSPFEPILLACLPLELVQFVRQLTPKSWEMSETYIAEHVSLFAKSLISSPHQFGIMGDTYINEKQREFLEEVASSSTCDLSSIVLNWKRRAVASDLSNDPLWNQDELIAIKGSDLILLYNSLLPYRGAFGYAQSSSSKSQDDDEWCLDSIRADLVSVMHELSSSPTSRTDGWQIFKVGKDGLVTDLGNDMGLNPENDESGIIPPHDLTLCNALAKFDAPSIAERLQAARTDAILRGDHLTVLHLTNFQRISQSHVDSMQHYVGHLKTTCRYLRDTLDQAALQQRCERERVFKLLTILDCARIHVWYDCEIRTNSYFARSRDLFRALYSDVATDEGDKRSSDPSGSTSSQSSTRSRRLSILSSHSGPESPFYSKKELPIPKLTDKEVDIVLSFMRRNRVRNVVLAEERFHRALVEVGNVARKLLDRDHVASYIMFKRDRHYQTKHAQKHSRHSGGTHANQEVQHNRRSSLGLFDLFDNSSSHYSNQHRLSLTLHTTTSTHFLGLASSQELLRNSSSLTALSRDSKSSSITTLDGNIGPPRSPSLSDLESLILSDIGLPFMKYGTETDAFMSQTGCMLLDGDGAIYHALLKDISVAMSPQRKLKAIEALVRYVRCVLQTQSPSPVSRADIVQDLSRKIGREGGTIFRDLQVVASLCDPALLDLSSEFEDCCTSCQTVLDTVVLRSMDYATRFMRYYTESTTNPAPRMAIMGINDSVAIWTFCAKQGNPQAQRKLADLYLKFPHLKLELRPLSRPSVTLDGNNSSSVRESVALHWMAMATRI